MTEISACMCVSRESFHESLNSLLKTEPDEVLVVAKTSELKESVGAYCSRAKIIVKKAEEPWKSYGKYDLFDLADGDWIVVLDDDDIAVRSYREYVGGLDGDVGIVFGDQEVETDGNYRKMKNNRQFTGRNAVDRRCGYYALREECWDEISEEMDTGVIIHDEARVFYWALRLGWKYEYVPKVFERKPEGGEPAQHWGFYSPGWQKVYEVLESGGRTEDWLVRWDEDILLKPSLYLDMLQHVVRWRLKK